MKRRLDQPLDRKVVVSFFGLMFGFVSVGFRPGPLF